MTDIATLGLAVDTRQVSQASKDLEALTKAGEEAEQQSTKLTRATDIMSRAIKIAATAWGTLKIAQYVKEVSLLQARYETLGVVLNVVGKNAGYMRGELDRATAALQKQGISMLESRQQTARLIQAHIDLSNASKLARIAQDAAVIANINSSEAFATLVHGIQSGQTEVLRNIGLNVSMEQSYKQIAAQLGKNVDQLTQNEKIQGVLNSVMRAGADIAGTYEAAMGTAGKQLTSMKRYVEDLKVTMGETFNEILVVSVMAFTDHLKGANKEVQDLSRQGELRAWGEALTDTFAAVADNVSNALGAVKMLATIVGHFSAQQDIRNRFNPQIDALSNKGFDTDLKAIQKLEAQRAAALAAEAQQYEEAKAAILKTEDRFSRAVAERRQANAEREAKTAAQNADKELQRLEAQQAARIKVLRAEEDKATVIHKSKNSAAEKLERERMAAAERDAAERSRLRNREYDEIEEYLRSEERARVETVRAANEAVKAAQIEYENFGKTRSQIGQLTVLRLKDKLAAVEAGTAAAQAIEQQIDAQERLNEIWKKGELLSEESNRFRDIWLSVDQTAKTAFVNIFEGGRDAFTRLRDTLKSTLLDLLYQMTVKKWIFNITASVTGASDSAIGSVMNGQGGGLMGNIMNAGSLLDMGKKLFDGFSTGFSSMGGQMSQWIQSGMNLVSGSGGTIMQGPIQVGPTASMLGTAGSYLGGIGAGVGIGRAIGNGYSLNGGSGNSTVNIGTAIGAFFGPLGAAIGGAIGGLVNRAFGRGPKEVQSFGFQGDFNDNGFSGQNFQRWKQKGGWFRSDKHGTDFSAMDAGFVETLSMGFKALKSSTQEFGKALGLQSQLIAGYSKSMTLDLSNDEAKNKEAIAGLFTTMGDEMASALLPNWAEFMQRGESASTTLQRLAGDFQVVEGVLITLGKTSVETFGAVGIATMQARERLISFAGGVESLIQGTQFFADNFLTEAERMKPTLDAVSKAMSELGYAGVTTKDAFKNVVLGLDLNSEAGAKMYATLLAIAPQFAASAEYLERIGMAAVTATGAITDTFIDRTAEFETGQAAIAAAQERLMRNAENAFMAVSRAIAAEKDRLQSEYDAKRTQLTAQADLSTEKLQSLRSVLEILTQAINTVRPMSRTAAEQVARRALRGSLTDNPDGLQTAMSVLSQNDTRRFNSALQMQREQARTANLIDQLKEKAGVQVSVAQLTLDAVNKEIERLDIAHKENMLRLDQQLALAQQQLDQLKGINTGTLSVAAAMANLQAAIAAAGTAPTRPSNPLPQEEPYNVTQTVINDAYNKYLHRDAETAGLNYWTGQVQSGALTVGGAIANIAGSNEAKVQNLYQSVLGRVGEAEGVDYWRSRLDAGVSVEAVKKEFLNSAEYVKKIRGYSTGGDHPGGWAWFGEAGPELVKTGPATVVNSTNSRKMMQDGAEAADLMRELLALLGTQGIMQESRDVAIVKRLSDMLALVKRWDQEGLIVKTAEDQPLEVDQI